MPLAPLLALALLTADPAPAPAVLPEEPVPAGAPSDDYGLVSWCTGALAGHMALFPLVKPELDALPDDRPKETAALDAEQAKAGRDYLTLYKKATDAAEKASPRPINERGLAMRRTGYAIWAVARGAADSKARMWTWLSWELPGRCETAAERLYEKSLLSAQALGIDLVGGSSAASQKPVTPVVDGPPKPTAPAKPGAKRPGLSAQGASTQTAAKAKIPAAPPIEDQIVAEIEGRPLPQAQAQLQAPSLTVTPPQAASPTAPTPPAAPVSPGV